MELTISSLEELPEVAKAIIDFAGEHRIFLFYGEMGAGKTTLIKALCAALDVKDEVSSPTFSIVNEYVSEQATIYHFDFYRIKTESEAFDLGYEEYFYSDNYCLIEWPEKIHNILPDRFVELKLRETSANERLIKMRRVN